MQDYIHYYNPSTVLSIPNEEMLVNGDIGSDFNNGTGYYLQFIDDTLEADQASYSGEYFIQTRIWNGDLNALYSGGLANFPSGVQKGEFVDPSSTYSNLTLYFYTTTVSGSNLGNKNVVTVDFPQMFGVGDLSTVTGNKRLQWRWARKNFPTVTLTNVSTYISSVSNINILQNYQFVMLNNNFYCGYVCKLGGNNIAIYKFIDGAINLAPVTGDNCLTLTDTTSIYGINFSQWINFNFFNAGSSALISLDYNKTNITGYGTTFYFIMATQDGNAPTPEYYYMDLYDVNKNKIFTSEIQYDTNLSVFVRGLPADSVAFWTRLHVFSNGVMVDGTLNKISTKFNPVINYLFGVSASYTSCNNYISLNFSHMTETFNAESCRLYINDLSESGLNYDFMAVTSSSLGLVNCYGLKNGHTYNLFISNNTGTIIQYQNLGTFTVNFEGFFLSDVENNISYQLKNVLDGGDSRLTSHIYEYAQNLKYSANSVGKNKYMSGSISGELAMDNSINSNSYVQSFLNFLCSNRSAFLQDNKGNAYSVFISEPTVSPLNNSVPDQPILVSFSWNEVGPVLTKGV